MNLEIITCLLCDAPANLKDIVVEVEGCGKVIKCECGLMYTTPKITIKQLKNLQMQYVPSCFFKDEESPYAQRIRQASYDMQRIEEYIENGKLFDIAAGSGVFLKTAQDRGWTVAGNDLSLMCCLLSNKVFNVKIRYGEFEEIELGAEKDFLDVITMFNAIEHLRDPVKTLELCAVYLKSGGMIYVRTPCLTVDDVKKNPQLPRHLYHFDEASITTVFEKGGFQIEDLEVEKDGIKRTLVVMGFKK